MVTPVSPRLLGLGSYRVPVERLEVEALVGDAEVSRVAHQGEHHLGCTLHPGPLTHALEAADIHPLIQHKHPTADLTGAPRADHRTSFCQTTSWPAGTAGWLRSGQTDTRPVGNLWVL